MYLRTLLILVLLSVLAIFAILNWNVLTASAPLSLGFTSVEAPLGIVLMAMFGLLALLFLIYVVYLQSSVLLQSRRHERELQAQRELADQAEVSRFNQLRAFLEAEIAKLAQKTEGSTIELSGHLEELERDLQGAIEQSGNALAASLAELDDRLERGKKP